MRGDKQERLRVFDQGCAIAFSVKIGAADSIESRENRECCRFSPAAKDWRS
jgi:hypothetical protein